MARRVTEKDITIINKVYYATKSFSETATRTGWSVATVKKYVDKDYKPVPAVSTKSYDLSEFPEFFDTTAFETAANIGDLCVLTDNERDEMELLWEEMNA